MSGMAALHWAEVVIAVEVVIGVAILLWWFFKRVSFWRRRNSLGSADRPIEIKAMPGDVSKAIILVARAKQRFDKAYTATDLMKYGKQMDRAVVNLLDLVIGGQDSENSTDNSNVVEVDFKP